MEKQNVRKELKALGSELAVALKQIRSSSEFKHLESEVVAGIKGISTSLVKSLKAAGSSAQTKKVANQFGRVVSAGSKKGATEAVRAQKAAVDGLRKVRSAVSQLRSKMKNRSSKSRKPAAE